MVNGKVLEFIKMSRKFINFAILIAFLASLPLQTSAKGDKAWGGVGTVYLNSPYGDYIADVGVLHSWDIGRYLSLGVGGKFSYVHTGNLGEWYSDDNQRYDFNTDKPLMSLDGVGTIGLYLPVVKNFGLYGEASLSFSILPWDYLEVKKYEAENPHTYDTKSVYAYNNFSPRLFGGVGVYYDFKQENSKLRIALGYGYGHYDAFHGCRKKTFDGQKLREHLPKAAYLHDISLKVMVYY